MSHIPETVPRRDRRKRGRKIGTVALVLLLTLLVGTVLAAGTPDIDWWVNVPGSTPEGIYQATITFTIAYY